MPLCIIQLQATHSIAGNVCGNLILCFVSNNEVYFKDAVSEISDTYRYVRYFDNFIIPIYRRQSLLRGK